MDGAIAAALAIAEPTPAVAITAVVAMDMRDAAMLAADMDTRVADMLAAAMPAAAPTRVMDTRAAQGTVMPAVAADSPAAADTPIQAAVDTVAVAVDSTAVAVDTVAAVAATVAADTGNS
jgi:hypothetical protein